MARLNAKKKVAYSLVITAGIFLGSFGIASAVSI